MHTHFNKFLYRIDYKRIYILGLIGGGPIPATSKEFRQHTRPGILGQGKDPITQSWRQLCRHRKKRPAMRRAKDARERIR